MGAPGQWLTLIGGFVLIVGVWTAFISDRYTDEVMGKARLGVAVLAPEPGTPEAKEKERKLYWADLWFKTGLGLTLVGGILQTVGGILPPKQ